MKEKYKNIVHTHALLLINLCASYQMKKKMEKKRIVPIPMVSKIDYRYNAAGRYRFVLVYQDHMTTT